MKTYASAIAASLMMFSVSASAQLAPAPKAPATAPAATAPAAPAVAKAATPAKAAVKAVSTCKGLDQTACTAKASECDWVVPKKVDAKTGKADASYCRKISGVAKAAADKKAAAAAAAAKAPAVKAPAAPAAAAPAAPAKK